MYKKDCESLPEYWKVKKRNQANNKNKKRRKRIEKDTKNILKNIVIREENCRVI